MTTVGRSQVIVPDLATAGGSSLKTAFDSMIQTLSDNASTRYKAYASVGDTATVELNHNLGVNLDEMTVILYVGSGLTKVQVIDTASYTIAEKSGAERATIEITNNTGGAVDLVVGLVDFRLTPSQGAQLVAAAPASPRASTLVGWYDTALRGLVKNSAGAIFPTNTLRPVHITDADSPVTAVMGVHYIADTTSGPITITAPATIQDYDAFQVSDARKTFNINNLTLGRNGNDIDGETEDFVFNSAGDGGLFIGDNTNTNWVKSGGGGGAGGLNSVFIDSGTTPAFSAEQGNHYFIDSTTAAVTVTLLETEGQVRFSDGSNIGSWGTSNAVTVNRSGAQTIMSAVSQTLDVDLTWVQYTLNEGKTDWLQEDAFVPTLSDGTTGTGEGGINYVTNSDAEDGVVEGVTATTVDVAQDVGTPIWGTASFELTSQATIGNVDWAIDITDSAPVASGLSLGVSGYFQTDANGSEGDWTVGIYNVTDAAYASEETDLKVDIQNIYRSIFTPLAGKTYVFRLRRVGTTISHVVLADKLTVTPDSNSSLVAFEQRTNIVGDGVLAVVASSSGLGNPVDSVGQMDARAYRDSNGEYILWFSGRLSSTTPGTSHHFTFAGVTYEHSANTSQAFSVSSDSSDGVTGSVDGPGVLTVYLSGSAAWNGAVTGTLKLSAKPDWFDANLDDNKVNLLTQNVVSANASIKLKRASFATVSGVQIPFNTVEFLKGGMTHAAGVVTVPSAGRYRIRCQVIFSTSADGNEIQLFKGGANFTRNIISASGIGTPLYTIERTMLLAKDDTIGVAVNLIRTLDSNIENNYLEVTRLPDYGAFDPIGFGLATSTQAGLVKADRFYQTALTGDVYGGVCATVSNLVVGRRYIATVSAVGRADSGAGVGNFSVVHDSGTLISIAINYTATNLDLMASGSIQFVATTTSVTLEVNAGAASGVRSRGGNIQLLELNSTEYGAF